MNTITDIYMIAALIRLTYSNKWQGTADDLLKLLNAQASAKLQGDPSWPKSAAAMIAKLHEIRPFVNGTTALSIQSKKKKNRLTFVIQCLPISSLPDTMFGILLEVPRIQLSPDKEIGINIPNQSLEFFRMAIGAYLVSLIGSGFRGGPGIEWSGAFLASTAKALQEMKPSSDLPTHYMDLSEILFVMDFWEEGYLSKLQFKHGGSPA